ncbi:hypothetical protein SASPL_152519 [Salvia splendens]|uniref:Uncharacterized protein n=1 Tax=Salvia splendens TaxID=180675 RepID=A0A8X8Z1C3_SALSN|nr:hypothetical protein SASPL_152519 [Salvia splendens]
MLRVTFLSGEVGVYALGAVVAHHNGDKELCQHYVSHFKEIKLSIDLPDKLLYGRARVVVNEIMRSGRKLGNVSCPLMYEWHGKIYWGAAHGVAGIMNVLRAEAR